MIFYQILSTHSLRKCIETSLENFVCGYLGLKGEDSKTRRSTTRTRFSQYFVERAREPESLGTLRSDNGDADENVDERFQRRDLGLELKRRDRARAQTEIPK